jgi:two-component system response regulator HydG
MTTAAHEQEFADGPMSQALGARISALAGSTASVLIRGASGSGKNLAAKMIHARSARASGPLVVVNLAALAPTLIEAELFGHEAGAFTGAQRARTGRFRQAEGGTLVLDDVDGLPFEVQVKLLRVLQERVVEPLGSEAAVPIDVRVIATTTQDLRALAERGAFRNDLYFRLAVVELEIPPLRARPEEIPALARRLSLALAARHARAPRELSDEAMALLVENPWPGNVRELENALERVLVCPAGEPGVPVAASELEFLRRELSDAADEWVARALSLGLTMEAIERALLRGALREARGNFTAAARRVGLSRRAFEYRIEHHAADRARKEQA